VPDLQRIGAKNRPVSNVLAEGAVRRATLLRAVQPAFRLRCRRRQLVCACLSRSPPFERARAAMTYGDVSQNLILAFKHGDRLDLAPLVVFWLFAAGGALIADADVVVPVPMHPGRLHRRRYNQAAVLARGRRHRPSGNEAHAHSEWAKSQGLRENHRRMIALTEAARQKLREQHMLLIDDVLTTGAAVTASTRALLSTRASQVDALTLARVI